MSSRAPWTVVLLSYPCPVCTAGPGERCLSENGRRKTEAHAARTRLASANDWKEAPVNFTPDHDTCSHCTRPAVYIGLGIDGNSYCNHHDHLAPGGITVI